MAQWLRHGALRQASLQLGVRSTELDVGHQRPPYRRRRPARASQKAVKLGVQLTKLVDAPKSDVPLIGMFRRQRQRHVSAWAADDDARSAGPFGTRQDNGVSWL